MTTYELADLSQSAFSNTTSAYAVLLSIVTALCLEYPGPLVLGHRLTNRSTDRFWPMLLKKSVPDMGVFLFAF